MEEKKTIPVTPPVTAARRVFPVDGRDRALLVLAWGVGVLCAEVLLWGLSGLGMTLLVAAWYGVLFWYGGRSTGQAGKPPSSVRRGPVGSDLRPVCQSVAPAVEHTGPRSADGNSNGGLARDGGVSR